jgi:hypothetical protein
VEAFNHCSEGSGFNCISDDMATGFNICLDRWRASPQLPPNCTQSCRQALKNVLTTYFGLNLLHCNCSAGESDLEMAIYQMCQPFQSQIQKCNIMASLTDVNPASTMDVPTTDDY